MSIIKLELLKRTFNHEGLINRIIHLFGDKYHVEHHLYPGIPQYNLGKLNRYMLGIGFGEYMQYRDTLLGEPRKYSETGKEGEGNA